MHPVRRGSTPVSIPVRRMTTKVLHHARMLIAARRKEIHVMEHLRDEHGVDVNDVFEPNQERNNLLMLMIQENNRKVADYLVAEGSIHVSYKNRHGQTAFDLCVDKGWAKLAIRIKRHIQGWRQIAAEKVLEGIESLPKTSPNLEQLTLPPEFSSAFVLAELPKLTSIDLSACEMVSFKDVVEATKSHHLTTIIVPYSATEKDIRNLVHFHPELEVLDLSAMGKLSQDFLCNYLRGLCYVMQIAIDPNLNNPGTFI